MNFPEAEVALTEGLTLIGMISGVNCGRISDCEISGDMTVNSTNRAYFEFGGIAGFNRGLIANCMVSGEILAFISGKDANVGGIVGNNAGIISQSVNHTELTIEAVKVSLNVGVCHRLLETMPTVLPG